jgi:class 3 adenylate cyclase/predicted ATPase
LSDGDLGAYVSALHASWLTAGDAAPWREVPGTLVFADVSGFTPLAERLARNGKIGAEELTDTLNVVFRELLDVAAGFGGDCLKFGGDALLLLFTGDAHAPRAAAAAHAMLAALRSLRRSGSAVGLAKLHMSLGVHTGTTHAFLVGRSHRELLVAGPTVSGVLALETLAAPGQILVSEATAAELDPGDVDETAGTGLRLKRAPRVTPAWGPCPAPPAVDAGDGIPELLRHHLDGSLKDGEHRLATIGFLKFGTTDQLLLRDGPAALARAFEALVTQVQVSCAEHDVTFLGSDVDRDGGKILLATGTPSASPDDEDLLLLALRNVLDAAPSLPLRAGVHRGRIFAVDLGSAERRAFTVMGDAVNLAARVMAHAGWGELLATTAVLDRVDTAFDLVAVAPFAVKGKSAPVVAQLVGAARGRRSQAPELTAPLVGRDRELMVIRAALAAVHENRGHVVEFVGDPGIGKSKLVSAMTTMDHDLVRLTIEAGRYSLATPYFALRRGLRAAIGVDGDAADDVVEDALRAAVARFAPELEPWLPLLAAPFGLELIDTAATARLDQSNRQPKLREAVVALMTRVLDRPTLLVIEDSHWLDAASCELLSALLAGIERRPWLAVITRRAVAGGLELAASADVATMRLEPLDDGALTTLAASSAQGVVFPPGVIEELVERSGGNPLFLQELVNAARIGVADELPETIEAVVATAIDALAPHDRALLREAAVLGNKFSMDVLVAMLGVPVARVERDVRRLSHFLVPNPGGLIRFRHVLLRDVAYEGLAFRARRALHHRAGTIIERSTAHPESYAELLSIHFHRAGKARESWVYSRLAGERAEHNGATVEAAAFYGHALEAARRLDDVGEHEQAAIAERLGDTWQLGGRYQRASEAYVHARRLAAGDSVQRGRLCRKIGFVRDHEGRYTDAQRWFRRGLREIDTASADAADGRVRAELMTASGSSKLRQGRHREAIPLLQQAIGLAEESGDRRALAHAFCQLDLAYSELGQHSSAGNSERALAIYEQLGDERGIAGACNQMGIAAYWRGEWDAAVALYGRALEADRRAGALVDLAIYVNNIGEIRSDQGRLAEAEALLQEAYEVWTGGGWRVGSAWAMSNLGRAAARAGRLDEASDRLAQAAAVFTDVGAEAMLLETQAREVERLVFAGAPDAAIEEAHALRIRADKLGLASVTNLLDRLEGTAWCQAGRCERGIALLERSIIDSRERDSEYDAALSMETLAWIGRRVHRPGTDVMASTASEIFGRLGVVAAPLAPNARSL